MAGIARLGPLQPLFFAAADEALDLPAFVRAASAVRRWRGRLAVLQDDVNALALFDQQAGIATALPLPPDAHGARSFSDARGNKARKMDLESCVVLPDGRLLALGSGSSPRRESLVLVDAACGVRIFDGGALFARLRERADFAGSELNIEGAVLVEGRLRLFQRGNGVAIEGRGPLNAIGDIDLGGLLHWLEGTAAPPGLLCVQPMELGQVGGIPFGFTDATALPDGRIAFLSVAEASPDARRDGPVLGVCFGILQDGQVMLTEVLDGHGAATRLKLEGIEYLDQTSSGALQFAVVADMDDADEPAALAILTWSQDI